MFQVDASYSVNPVTSEGVNYKVRKNMIRVGFHIILLKLAPFAYFDANTFVLIGLLHKNNDNHCNLLLQRFK